MVSKKTNEDRFVGAFLPRQTSAYLSLYSLCKKESKSKIVREMLNTWEAEHIVKFPVDELLSDVIGKIQKEWGEKRKVTKEKLGNQPDKLETAFELFKFEVNASLKNRIDDTHVGKILESLTL